MKTPLQTYKELAEQFGITDKHNVSDIGKLGFAREQVNQMQLIINRNLVDLTTNRINEALAKDETTASAYRNKANDHENSLRQTKISLDTLLELVEELEKEATEE